MRSIATDNDLIIESVQELFQSCLEEDKDLVSKFKKIFETEPAVRQRIVLDLLERVKFFFNHNDANLHYRTFDPLDLLFGIEYASEDESEFFENRERLYLSAGAGVQTGYSNLFESIDRMKLMPGQSVIDLGSGYGRLGYLIGFLFQEVSFKGYEFVFDRVEEGNSNLSQLGLSSKIQFLQQDLSCTYFKLPWAHVYYMYDPFTRETYQRVIDQLCENSKQGAFKIITKGAATEAIQSSKTKFAGVFRQEKFDQGNLCLFELE